MSTKSIATVATMGIDIGKNDSALTEAQREELDQERSALLGRRASGDSRGHWEGNTLIIDVTNFGPKADFQGSRENLHLVERWTRTSASTLECLVTIEDPTVWTRPWTVSQEFTKQSEQQNRIYYEPRCVEGNYGLPGLLHGRRIEEVAFAEGRGPDPATKDYIGSLVDTAPAPQAQDPFQ